MNCEIMQRGLPRPMKTERTARVWETTWEGRLIGKGGTWNDRSGTGRRTHMVQED